MFLLIHTLNDNRCTAVVEFCFEIIVFADPRASSAGFANGQGG